MPSKKKVTPVVEDGYWIVSRTGQACTSDHSFVTLPPERYDTFDEAVERLPALFREVALKCSLPRGMPIPDGALNVKVCLTDSILGGRFIPAGEEPSDEEPEYPAASKEDLVRAFKEHPSVSVTGVVKFYESDMDFLHCFVQGTREIREWMETPDAKELTQYVRSVGAEGLVGGVVLR